jgi:enediyne biosynthesis protein E4
LILFPSRFRASTLLLVTMMAMNSAAQFREVTTQAGIRFQHNSGRAGKKWLPETMGSGCAFFDADGDGWPDILLVNSRAWTPNGRSFPALYRNNRNGTFTDITAASGLRIEMYGLGVSAADYDGDGHEDLYITAMEGDRLFHNEGGGRFTDATKASGIANAAFGTSSAWLDYDRDGKPDLFVANYVAWNAKADIWCSLDGSSKSYCTPESYKGNAPRLYRNLGGGRFADVAAKAGVADRNSKALGIAVFDYDNDGWSDLFVANDTQPNKLYRNNGNGTFRDDAVAAGVAFGEDGVARGAMGVDAADYDRSGRTHLLVGNFSNQMLGLYHNEGKGLFVDEAPRTSIGRISLLSLTFGTFFFDFDLDGWLDIFCANGHIDEEINRVQPKIQFRQKPLLFRNLGKGRFEDASLAAGPDFQKLMVARGAAYADFDRDGDLDVLVSTNHGPARLFRNEQATGHQFLNVKLSGANALGAVVRVEAASGTQSRTVHTGSSYCSQSDTALTFGLGRDKVINRLEVTWASGKKQSFNSIPAGQFVLLSEGKATIDKR